MPIKLKTTPLVERFELVNTDLKYSPEDEKPTMVAIKQATQAQHEIRQQTFATLERRYNDLAPEETVLVQRANTEELKRLETWLTLVGCNIAKEDDNTPLFPTKKGRDGIPELDMTRGEFDGVWGLLPPDVATEIHQKVLELNIMWSPRGG